MNLVKELIIDICHIYNNTVVQFGEEFPSMYTFLFFLAY